MLLTAINYIDRASLSVALPLISSEFNLQPWHEGLLLSAFFWSYALMQIPVGLLIDRFQARNIIGIATVTWGAFQALGAASTGWTTLLLTRMGLGVAESPIFPAGAKLNSAWLTPNERGRGAVLLDGGAPLGTALGALIIAGLITLFGSWQIAFVIAGVGTMAAGLWAWRVIRDHPTEHPAVNAAELAHIQNSANLGRKPIAAERVPFRTLIRDRSVLSMFAGYSCITSVFYGLLTWMPSYLHQTHGLNIAAMGSATFGIFMCGFVGELIGGVVADRWRSNGGSPNLVMRSMFSGSALVAAICILGVAYSANTGTAIALLCVALFFIRWCGMYWSLPAILGEKSKVATLAGMMNFFGNIAGVIVPILVGALVQYTDSYFAALLFFVVMALLLALFSCIIDYRERGAR
ncbi:MFS transporter [Rhizobium sullae]|nr:MFS transporter [Rhizobium sullae]